MPQDSLWQAVLGEVELSVSRGNFVTWFKNTTLLRHDGNTVIIGVPNVFIKQQLERKYADLLRETLKKNGATPSSLIFKIQDSVKARESEEPLMSYEEIDHSTAAKPESTHTSQSHTYSQGLNERYTF